MRTKGASMDHEVINPYCGCDPCRCERPCRCGLTQVGHRTDEVWDPERQELRYTVTQTFKPTERTEPPEQGGSGGHTGRPDGGNHGTVSDATLALGEPADLLDASLDADARRAALLRVYETTSPGHAHATGHSSERTATHRGHTITIRTTYEALIDGEVLEAHMGVGDDGNVHYHGLPNYATASAVDLLRQIIDSFPDDYPDLTDAEEAD